MKSHIIKLGLTNLPQRETEPEPYESEPANAAAPAAASAPEPSREGIRDFFQRKWENGRDFFKDRKAGELWALQATSDVATVGALVVAKGLPGLGNKLNLYNFAADIGTAIERGRALRAGHPGTTRMDFYMDTFGVLGDFAGIVFPPVQWVVQPIVLAWDGRETFKYFRDPAKAASPEPALAKTS